MINLFLILLLLFISVFLILFYVLKWRPRNSLSVKDLYAEGLDLMVSGKRKSAYKNFKDIINKDSDNIKAYLRLGQVLREGGNASHAIKIHRGLNYRRNLTYYDKIEIHKNLALDYYEFGNITSAILELEKLLKIEKNNEWALSHLSTFYQYKQDWENAGKYFQKYQKLTNKIDHHKLALYKIQEARVLINEKKFVESRKIFEEALNINSDLAVAYYYIGNSYSSESEGAYQDSMSYNLSEETSRNDKTIHLEKAKELLSKAVPMWIRYAELKPQQAWMVIHLLKDALFALDRYSEFEDILKQILKKDSDNIEVIASLSEIFSHRGEDVEAIELIDTALEKDNKSLIVKLIKMKLEAKKQKNSVEFIKGLDDIIHFLVKDEGFQIYKNTATDTDIIWLYETSEKLEA